ncbi:MAG: nuclear transport factor 2 family protein [Candidatus Thorarchaeota archaeon]
MGNTKNSSMDKSRDIEKVKKTLGRYYSSQEHSNKEEFLSVWHADARRISFGNDNKMLVSTSEDIIKYTIDGLRIAKERDPDFYVNFQVNEIKHVAVHDVVASAEVDWKMEMPMARGFHSSFFHLAKIEDEWIIIGLTDRGVEEPKSPQTDEA